MKRLALQARLLKTVHNDFFWINSTTGLDSQHLSYGMLCSSVA